MDMRIINIKVECDKMIYVCCFQKWDKMCTGFLTVKLYTFPQIFVNLTQKTYLMGL